jgi:hypothetical protein
LVSIKARFDLVSSEDETDRNRPDACRHGRILKPADSAVNDVSLLRPSLYTKGTGMLFRVDTTRQRGVRIGRRPVPG